MNSAERLRVLCVDDDAGVRELYQTLLRGNGYEVIAASDGRHALHVFQCKKKRSTPSFWTTKCRE